MNGHQIRLMERKRAITSQIQSLRVELHGVQKQLDSFAERQKLVTTVARMEPADKDEVIRQLQGRSL